MGKLITIFTAALAALATAAPAVMSAPARSTTAPVDGAATAKAMRALLDKYYVVEALRPKFDTAIDASLAAGRYNLTDPEKLNEQLNKDLRAVTGDKHLRAMYDPEGSAKLAAAGPDAGADDAPPSAEDIAEAERENHGLAQLRVLPGNVRYLETTGFLWAGPSSERAYDTAMRFLSGGDAIIIDMRKNGGGSPEAVRYLVSHFMPPNKPLMTFQLTTSGPSSTSTLPTLNAPKMSGKPLYVLTSGRTASAAEEFVGHVAGYKLGELIGENTAGAGFRNQFFALPGGFVISISIGQAILASTGKGWEGVGFAPDTAVAVENALEVAQAHALARLASKATPELKRSYETQAALLKARISPVKTALPLEAYAGDYGERTVRVEGDGLMIVHKGGQKGKLVAIGPNLFVFDYDGQTTVSFDVSGGRSVGLHIVSADGLTADDVRTN